MQVQTCLHTQTHKILTGMCELQWFDIPLLRLDYCLFDDSDETYNKTLLATQEKYMVSIQS
jgi:hypothetical protein